MKNFCFLKIHSTYQRVLMLQSTWTIVIVIWFMCEGANRNTHSTHKFWHLQWVEWINIGCEQNFRHIDLIFLITLSCSAHTVFFFKFLFMDDDKKERANCVLYFYLFIFSLDYCLCKLKARQPCFKCPQFECLPFDYFNSVTHFSLMIDPV